MKQIMIEDDAYDLLLHHRIGFESESELLRRVLGNGCSATVVPKSESSVPKPDQAQPRSDLVEFLDSPRFLVHSDQTTKFLHMLSWLHSRNPDGFEAAIAMSGGSRRTRMYYGTGRKEVEGSGNSVHPKPIPNSPYWVVTNNDTATKRKMLKKVMQILRYSSEDTVLAVSALKLASEK